MNLRSLSIVATAMALALPLVPGAEPLLFHDHGHGLSFSTDGGALLAPSRSGLAVYENGAWWEAPGPAQGFSGFSATERAIYSSGHSRMGAALGKPLGLARSVDGGRTWQPLALAGEADFSLLAAGYRSDAIYVLNSRSNSAMAAAGLYVTRDEGKSWRRAGVRGLAGEIHGIAAHPRDPDTVAVGSSLGLYLSRDAGESFRRLDSMGAVTALAFDLGGERLRYARALSGEILELALDGRKRPALRLPPLPGDYVTCLAQNPKDELVLALATRRRDVYRSADGGANWRRIASEGDSGTTDIGSPKRDPENMRKP